MRAAAKSAKPDCIIWLTAFSVTVPEVADSRMLREVDWLMNESPDPAQLAAARKMKGPHTRLIQCICGWGDKHDPMTFVHDPASADVGLYGYTAADLQTTLPSRNPNTPQLIADAKNVERIRQIYRITDK